MKQTISTIIAVLLALFLIVLVHFGWLYYKEDGSTASRRIEIKVSPGSTFADVQELLELKGLVKRPSVFRWAAYLTGREKRIKAGRYLFREGESVAAILGKLSRGEVDYTRVIVPEGYMVKEIAGVLQQNTEIDSLMFFETAMDTALTRRLGVSAPSLEGYLFPDTYLFSWPLSPRDVAERMVYRFYEVFADSLRDMANSLGFTVNEVVTLASIIQAEAVFDSEMPRISAVFHNRLHRSMRLEADPTVAYALGGVRRRLWFKDLRVRSPYNTYRRRGLPPGPICSPGRAAILAAVTPLEGCNDLYFVADGTGRHVFSRSLDKHLEAKMLIDSGHKPWLKKRVSEADSIGSKDAQEPREVTVE
jgi:UPF0755 protein